MSKSGIIKGYEDGSFRPSRQVTYGEFIKMVYIAVTGTNLEQPKNSHWAMNYYTDSIKAGLFNGNDIKTDQLDDVIPRNIMALLAANSLKVSVSDMKDIISEISDVDEETEYCYEIAVSYKEGILNGYPDGTFKPYGGLSRAEAAKTVYGLINKIKTEESGVKYTGKQDIVNRDFSVETYETVKGYKGITCFVYNAESGCLGVYSDKMQDISLFIDGNKAMPVANKDGDYWKENESYVYVFDVKDIYKKSSKIGLAFGAYIEEVFYYTDAFN